MESSLQSNNQDGKSCVDGSCQYAPRAISIVCGELDKISKLKNSVSTSITTVASPDRDSCALEPSDYPTSPRPVHASTEASSQAAHPSAPGSMSDTEATHVEVCQHPDRVQILGKNRPPPGFTSAAYVPAGHQSTAGNQDPTQGQHSKPRGFRRLPCLPGFGSPFGNRCYTSGSHPPVMLEKCFPLSSTRIYDSNLRCSRCGARSDFGWFYRCSHDTDARLYASIQDGNKECFDEIGEILARDLIPPPRSAALRQDKLSPIKEMKAGQVQTYTSEQLVTILKQHEKAVETALSDRYGPFLSSAGERPYLVGQAEECKTVLCPRCGRGGMGEDLAWLSLDGVLKGDIPATAVVGYGFRALGGRAVADAHVVKNVGLRDLETGKLPEKKAAIRDECAVYASSDVETRATDGETTTLETEKGFSFLAMGDWKVPPEVELVDRASIMAVKGNDSNDELLDYYAKSQDKEGSEDAANHKPEAP